MSSNLLLLKQITSAQTAARPNLATADAKTTTKTFSELQAAAHAPLARMFPEPSAIADDVQAKTLKNYLAFRRLKNFACLEIHARAGRIVRNTHDRLRQTHPLAATTATPACQPSGRCHPPGTFRP